MKSKRILGLTVQAIAVLGLVSTSVFAQRTIERSVEKGKIEELRRELEKQGIKGERARELEREFTEYSGRSADISKVSVGAFLKEVNANGPRGVEAQTSGKAVEAAPVIGIGGLGLVNKGAACELTAGGNTDASVIADLATARRLAGSTEEVVDQQRARLNDIADFAKLSEAQFNALSPAERSAIEARYEESLTKQKGEVFTVASDAVLAANAAGLELSTEGVQKTINSWGTDTKVLTGLNMIFERIKTYLRTLKSQGIKATAEMVVADIRKFLVGTGKVSEEEANEFGTKCAPSLLGLRPAL